MIPKDRAHLKEVQARAYVLKAQPNPLLELGRSVSKNKALLWIENEDGQGEGK